MVSAQEILARCEHYQAYTAENLAKLVSIKSLSLDEAEVARELERQMQEAGFDEVRRDALGNVIGRIGQGAKVLAIDGHIDTVDMGQLENWDFDPLSGLINDGFVHGRGTVDQKGGVAAFVTAGRILKELGLDQDVTLYCTGSVMEEDCDGLCWKYLIEEEKLRPDAVIITEPTNLNLYRGHRGRMEMHASFYGRSAHGSAPERGDNAIYAAARACLAIEQLNERLPSQAFLGKGSITLSEIISDSPSLCAVADYARIHMDRRLTWGETKASAVQEVEALLQDLNAKVEVLDYQVRSYTGLEYGMEKYYPTWVLAEDHSVVQRGVQVYQALFAGAPKIDKWTFSTNAVTIQGNYGIPCLGFGPGNEVLAHAPNERTPLDHLVKAAAFYVLYTQQFAEDNHD